MSPIPCPQPPQSPSSSAGLSGSPRRRCKAAQVETAQAPGPDTADRQNRGVLGEDNPQAPGPGLDKGCPLCSCASLPCSSPEPAAWSCILLPCPQAQSPQGLFSRPLSPPRPQDVEGDPSPSGRWQWDGQRGLRTSRPPLCLQLTPQGSWLGVGNGLRWKGDRGCREEGPLRPTGEGLCQPHALVLSPAGAGQEQS